MQQQHEGEKKERDRVLTRQSLACQTSSSHLNEVGSERQENFSTFLVFWHIPSAVAMSRSFACYYIFWVDAKVVGA
jgi:hypothetical protein